LTSCARDVPVLLMAPVLPLPLSVTPEPIVIDERAEASMALEHETLIVASDPVTGAQLAASAACALSIAMTAIAKADSRGESEGALPNRGAVVERHVRLTTDGWRHFLRSISEIEAPS